MGLGQGVGSHLRLQTGEEALGIRAPREEQGIGHQVVEEEGRHHPGAGVGELLRHHGQGPGARPRAAIDLRHHQNRQTQGRPFPE
jgi:hypothetical protein